MRVIVAAGIALYLTSMAAAVEKKSDEKADDRLICEKQEVVGSRLATRRVCMTAAQWRERRLEQRQALEKIQTPGSTNESAYGQ